MKQLTIFNSENAERETGFYYLCAWIYTLTVTLTPDSMKTTQATVNLVLNAQRKNKDGLCPIVLRIFWKGRKDRQTGIYIPKSQWLVKEQCVKPTHPQSGTLNLRLQEIKNAVIQRRNLLVAKGLDYTIDDLLSEKEVLSYGSSLSSILERMISDKGLSQNTAMAYKASLKRLSSVGVNSLSDVSEDAVQGICKRLKGTMSDSTVNVTMASLGSLWGYCQTKGLVEGYLFSKFKFWKKYRISEKHRTLEKPDIERLLGWFLRESVSVDLINGEWSYTERAARDLGNRNSELFAVCCGLMCYYLTGIAFCDLVRIKSENISVEEIDGKEYYRIKGLKRKKTNQEIKGLIVECTNDTMPLFQYFLWTMDKREEYLLPVLGGYGYNGDKQISEAIGSCSTVVNKRLREVFAELGIKVDGVVSYYLFRHTVAKHLYMSGVSPYDISVLMARSVNGITRYIQTITSDSEIIRERSKLF